MHLQSRGADPSIRTENYDAYLNPGKRTPVEEAIEEDGIRDKLRALEAKYASVQKTRQPNADIGCWWTLYDYGLDSVKKWATDHKHVYPGTLLFIHADIAYDLCTSILLVIIISLACPQADSMSPMV